MADSKWGGIDKWAEALYLNAANQSLPTFEAELRRRVEPLLEAAEVIVAGNSQTTNPKSVLAKELATWQSK